MRVLVTGGAGFIGSNVVAALEERGDSVVVADTFGFEGQWRNLSKRGASVEVAIGSNFIGELDAVVHMAAISSPAEADQYKVLDTNLRISQRGWYRCVEAGIPFVYASSAGVYGNDRETPLTPYAWSKLLFDRWALKQAAEGKAPPGWTGLRFTNVYGPNEYHKPDPSPIATWWRDGVITVYHDPLGRFVARDFVWVGDVVDVVLWALDHCGSGIYDVGTGRATEWADMAKLFRGLSGRKLDKYTRPYPPDLLPRYQWHTRADLTALRAAGYDGEFTPPADGVRKYVQEYLATGDPYR